MHWSDVTVAAQLDAELFPDQTWSAEQFWSELAGVPATRWYVVAEVEGEIAGYAGLYAIPGADADVQTVAVDPRRQGAGIGTGLVAELLAEARRRGCHRVFLEVAADNERAQSLYGRAGFERVSIRRAYYAGRIDAIIMRKESP